MTDARVSQLATEVLRTNLAPTADLSQLAVEVLISNLSIGAGSASGTSSSSVVGDSASATQDRTVTTAGEAIVTGIIEALISADFSAAGAATVSSVGVTALQGAASAAGAASVSGIGLASGIAVGLCSGVCSASAVGVLSITVQTAGTSSVNGVGRFIYAADTQIPGGISCDNNTQDATGDIGNTGVGVTTQIPDTLACGTLTGAFAAGPSGSYTHPTICSQTAYHCPEDSWTPTMPFDPVWSWKKLDKIARCCDISWAGDEIIIGTYDGSMQINGQFKSSDGYVYLSRDKGSSWVKQPLHSSAWQSVTMTANASLLGAYERNNGIHYISNDGGAGWSAVAHSWVGPLYDAKVCDLGNVFMVGLENQGMEYIYISKNYAVTWSAVTPFNTNTPWYDQAYRIGDMSSEGMVCYAGKYYPFSPGKMSKSTDYGTTWEPLIAACAWADISCSGDGKYVIGTGWTIGGEGLTWLSSNKGISFRSIPVWGSKTAMSTTGQVQAYIASGVVYVSKNYGTTFNAVTELNGVGATDIAINATGSVIVVCFSSDYVHIGLA